MNGQRISVAMCTHNGARFLPEQLESIAAQTRLPDELVICDDRSTDESVEIIETFLHHVPFAVRLEINDGNRGPTKNFEKAIGLCQGEIVALADQDDIWLPAKLELIGETLHQRPKVAAVFSDAELIDEHSNPLNGTLWDSFAFTSREQRRFKSGHALDVLLKHYTVTGATMAFRQEYRDLVLPAPCNHFHDSWISFLLASVAEIALIEGPTIRYRRHPDQQCGLREKKTFSEQVVSRMRAHPSGDLPDINRLEEVCERLIERSAVFPCHKNAIPLIREKIRHRQTRATPPKSRISRFLFVLRELITLRYWRYSSGLKSAAKDLFVCFVPQR